MKKLNTILIILALFTLLSCSDSNKISFIVIENNVSNSTDRITLEKYFEKYTPDKTNEHLVFRLSQDKPDYYLLTIGDYSANVYLAQGDSIFVSSKLISRGENQSYTGAGALLNNYLLSDKYFTERINEETDFNAIFSLNPLEFARSIDSLYNFRNNHLNEFITTNKIKDENFIKTEQKRIFYEASVEKNLYYRDHKFLTGQTPTLNNKFNSYLSKVDFNDSTLLHMDVYRNFLYTYFESIALQKLDLEKSASKMSFTEIAYQFAIERITNSVTRDYVLYRIMDIHLNETEINKLGNLIDDFNKKCTNNKFKEKINNYYTKLNKLKSGMPAPEFTFPDRNGKEISLSDFKGKLVYIDVWNSHCSPCFKEFLFLEKLIEKDKDQEIIFIGISFDSDENLWKKPSNQKH